MLVEDRLVRIPRHAPRHLARLHSALELAELCVLLACIRVLREVTRAHGALHTPLPRAEPLAPALRVPPNAMSGHEGVEERLGREAGGVGGVREGEGRG